MSMVRFEFKGKEIPFLKQVLKDGKVPTSSRILDAELKRSIMNFAGLQLYARREGLEFYVDEYLCFLEGHFEGDSWVNYGPKHQKSGTMRYKEGVIRIPATDVLPGYETQEYNQGKMPRVLVEIPQLVIANAQDLHKMEIRKAGFRDHDHMIDVLQQSYPTIRKESMVTLYAFGDALWRPTKRQVAHYAEK
jgi:hypothetical protein